MIDSHRERGKHKIFRTFFEKFHKNVTTTQKQGTPWFDFLQPQGPFL